jgi:hypothetical protein
LKRWIFLLLAAKTLHAAPTDNPLLPYLLEQGFCIEDSSWTSPQCAFSFDYLIEKKLRNCHSSSALEIHKASIRGLSEIGIFIWNIKERLNIQLSVGSGQFSWEYLQQNTWVKGFARNGVLWSSDIKWAVFNIRETFFSLDAQAGGWDWMDGSSTVDSVPSASNAESLLRYWQVGGAITQRVSIFSPYLGCAVNRTRMKIWNLPTGTGRMHAKHEVGPFGGCSISTGNRFLLNLEWRGWFEEGFSMAMHIRF